MKADADKLRQKLHSGIEKHPFISGVVIWGILNYVLPLTFLVLPAPIALPVMCVALFSLTKWFFSYPEPGIRGWIGWAWISWGSLFGAIFSYTEYLGWHNRAEENYWDWAVFGMGVVFLCLLVIAFFSRNKAPKNTSEL